jgi:hypothetical protein
MRKTGEQYWGGIANEEDWGTGTGEAQLMRKTGDRYWGGTSNQEHWVAVLGRHS